METDNSEYFSVFDDSNDNDAFAQQQIVFSSPDPALPQKRYDDEYVHGVSLKNVELEEHRRHIRRFLDKTGTNVKREVQSEVTFFSQMPCSQDRGCEIRSTYKNLDKVALKFYYILFCGIQSLCKFQPVQRSLKVAYNVNTFISNYVNLLEPFLRTFLLVDTSQVPKSGEAPIEQIFAQVNSMADNDGIAEERIREMCMIIAAYAPNMRITSVIFTRSGKGTPIFIPIQELDNKKETVVIDASVEAREQQKVLQIIPINIPFSPIDMPGSPQDQFSGNTQLPFTDM